MRDKTQLGLNQGTPHLSHPLPQDHLDQDTSLVNRQNTGEHITSPGTTFVVGNQNWGYLPPLDVHKKLLFWYASYDI